MARYKKKQPVDLVSVLRLQSSIKRSDLITGYAHLRSRVFDYGDATTKPPTRDAIDKRLQRRPFNGRYISTVDAFEFVQECWIQDGGDVNELAALGFVGNCSVVLEGTQAQGEFGELTTLTGSDEDREELKYLRVKTNQQATEIERLRAIEKRWLSDRKRREEINQKISKGTKGKKKQY